MGAVNGGDYLSFKLFDIDWTASPPRERQAPAWRVRWSQRGEFNLTTGSPFLSALIEFLGLLVFSRPGSMRLFERF